MTGAATGGGQADRVTGAQPVRARPARRAPAELTYRLDDELVERRAAEEPDWLAADRQAGLEAFHGLPTERANQLYTPYIDLRAAALEDVRAYEARRRAARRQPPRRTCPDGYSFASPRSRRTPSRSSPSTSPPDAPG